jgi:branched-chain amino acid aminotransferase
MAELQQPEWVYMNGRLCRWEAATLHISTEAVTRGLNVFEGLKGYWNRDSDRFALLALRRHFARLCRSAQLLHIPCPVSYDEFQAACCQLVKALANPDRDMWVRASLYVTEGHWGEGTKADLVLTAYHQDKSRPRPIDVGVSTWQRAADIALPPRIKTSSNYQVARLARIEGRGRGFTDMILLNQWGRVAEATGSCVMMVSDGQVVVPPVWEGRLESITVSIVAAICKSLEIPFVERPIERTELYLADELCLVGTLTELVIIRRVDETTLPRQSPLLSTIAEQFWSAVRGIRPHAAIELTVVPDVKGAKALDGMVCC